MSALHCGIVWSTKWTEIGEGPYTLAAKVLSANDLKVRYFKSAIHWKQGKGASLLDPHPINSNNEAADALGRMLRQASLAARIPRLFMELATDRELRYCVKCMSSGFQAAVAQIQGIERCPIHGDIHRSSCAHCGAKTPPYFLEDNGCPPSLSCRHCGLPLGGNVLLDRRFDAWKVPANIQRLSPLHSWLDRINGSRELQWVSAAKWSATRISAERTNEYTQQALFEVLRARLLPDDEIPESSQVQRPEVFGPIHLSNASPAGHNLTQSDYNDILRQLALPADLRQFRRHFRTPSFGVAVPTSCVVPPELHAHLIWRAQFEKVSSTYSESYSRAEFCRELPRLLNTGMGEAEIPICSAQISKGILEAAWAASLRIAVEWHRLLIKSSSTSLDQPDRDWLISVDRWANRLGCWRHREFFPIAAFMVRDLATGDSHAYFVVA